MELNKINSTGNWGSVAEDINQNFSKVNNAVEQVKNATTRNKGYYSTEADLKSAFTTANVGDIAYVGDAYPYQTWTWNGTGWVKKNNSGGDEQVNLGNYYTKDETDGKFDEADEKLAELGSEVNRAVQTFVERNSTNLIDESKFLVGYGIQNGYVVEETALSISDYIPVKEGINIVSNAFISSFFNIGVYDAGYKLIRFIKTESASSYSAKYEYQEGDVYVRFNFANSTKNKQANYGDTLLDYSEYNPIKGYLGGVEGVLSSNVFFKNESDLFAAVKELYLEGLSDGESYHISMIGNYSDENMQLYIANSEGVVCAYYDGVQKDGIIQLKEWQESGLSGYAILNIDGVKARPASIDLDIDKVSDIDYSPSIKSMFLNESQDNANIVLNNKFDSKVDINSQNLIDESKFLVGYGLLRGILTEVETLSVSDYIPVKEGVSISSNSFWGNLWGIGVYDEKHNLIRYLTDSGYNAKYTYQEGDVYVRFSFANNTKNKQANYGEELLPYSKFNPIGGYLGGLETKKEYSYTFDVAEGNLTTHGTYKSEVRASSIYDSKNNFVGFSSVDINKKREPIITDNVVAIDHDDIPQSDYIDNRKLYNKYGFVGNFNYILRPFTSISDKNEKIENYRKMLKDGNSFGLHAIMGFSFWIINKLFDVRPDGSRTFAPTLNEIRGSNSDGTGVNVFGVSITSSTSISSVGFGAAPGYYDRTVVSMTNEDYSNLLNLYTLYNNTRVVEGLDLNDVYTSKTCLEWIEYWYNNLIDSSLGYSEGFASDYEGTYPDAEHLLSGKVVFFDDTSNPNFTNSEYQKVGRFTKGLFKGAASCCNYEAVGRCIQVATAFARKYFGLEKFDYHHIHGGGYFSQSYKDADGMSYVDRTLKVATARTAKMYRTWDESSVSIMDILIENGIRIADHSFVGSYRGRYYGEHKFYLGQDYIRGGGINNATASDSYMGYMNFFGTNEDEVMSYENFKSFLNGENNWLKFAYENAGKDVTRNNLTYRVFPHIKRMIDAIRGNLGTGKVTTIAVDTMRFNPSMSTSIELVLRYCYENNIQVVTLEEARQLCSKERVAYFPNPTFNQNLIDMWGESSVKSAFIPDGWHIANPKDGDEVTVTDSEIEGISTKSLSWKCIGASNTIMTKMWGLKPGKYKLSFYAKCNDSSSHLFISFSKNSDILESVGTRVEEVYPSGSEWKYNEVEFVIPSFKKKIVTLESDVITQVCDGNEDAVCSVNIGLYSHNGGIIEIANPSIILL